MSEKTINFKTKFLLILTILGSVILTIYMTVFSEGFLLYHNWHTYFPVFCVLICIVGVSVGIPGIFGREINIIDRVICLVLTSFYVGGLLYLLSMCTVSREMVRRTSCSSNLKQIYLSLQQYATDYAGYYPPPNGAAGLEMLRKNDYLTDYSVYTCPSTATIEKGGTNQTITEENTDYVYIGGLNKKSTQKLLLIYEKANNHGGYFGNVLWADGAVEQIEGDPWTKNLKK